MVRVIVRTSIYEQDRKRNNCRRTKLFRFNYLLRFKRIIRTLVREQKIKTYLRTRISYSHKRTYDSGTRTLFIVCVVSELFYDDKTNVVFLMASYPTKFITSFLYYFQKSSLDPYSLFLLVLRPNTSL